jgi:ankyrin repeat protein
MDSQSNNQNANPAHRSCLHIAAKHGENEILRFILSEMYKQQCSLDIQDLNGNTAAHLAAKYNHLDCLQVI